MHAYIHQYLNPTSSSRLAASPPTPPPPPSSRGTMTGSPSSHIWGYVSPLFAGCLTWQSFMCVTWLVYVCRQPMFHGSWLIQVYGHSTFRGTLCTSQLSCRHCSLHRMLDMAIVHVCDMTCLRVWATYVCWYTTHSGMWTPHIEGTLCASLIKGLTCVYLFLRNWLVRIAEGSVGRFRELTWAHLFAHKSAFVFWELNYVYLFLGSWLAYLQRLFSRIHWADMCAYLCTHFSFFYEAACVLQILGSWLVRISFTELTCSDSMQWGRGLVKLTGIFW